ncbi:helix-turn-helix transcriptional regulator [Cellulomonas hominis]|uniref:helix-turn-helix transcriptional regulator n=1 Tax=Cellulomonas hominis TaxID=156981 RepID=UPI001B94208A|nr:LuxR family transcriptional regulator [Cellulomonas hominis]VTR75263.1 Transcriptional regulatory protein LiaR [Cellulomonas hominis]
MSVPAATIDLMTRSVAHAPFVARDEQVAALLAAVDRAAAGEPGLVLLGADAGVGKTRLLTHVARLAGERGATVVVSHCIDLGEIGLPYLPFAEALHQLVADDRPGVAEVVAARPALRRLLPSTGVEPAGADEQTERLQLFDGVAAVLAAAARPDAPLVLVVEDLHWADSSSRDLLRFLVARLRAEPVLVVGSYRADDLHRRHPLRPVLAELGRHPRVERIDLPPFTSDELRAFTTSLAGGPLPEDALRRIQQRSEGNAYFAEELLEARGAGTDLPGTLADVLRARLEQLDPEVQRLARAASAAGRRVDEPLLRAVVAGAEGDPARHAAFDAALRDAVAHHVLVGEDGRIAFRHALLAEAVYTDLLPGEQVALHRDYLLAAAADPALATPAERAHHALLSHDNRLALVASRDAAREAGRVLAPAEELRHLETVLRLWPGVPTAADDLGEERVDVLLAAAAAGGRAGLGDRAVAMAREAVAAVDRQAGAVDVPAGRRVAALRTSLARHLLAVERVEEALRETGRALADLAEEEGVPSADRAWALATHARAALNADLDDQAEVSASAAVDEARAAGAADAEADALISLAVLVVEDRDRAADLLTGALHRARDAGDVPTELRCTYNLAANRFYAGRLDEAAGTIVAGLELAARSGLTWSAYGVELRLFAEIVRYTRGDLSRPAPTADPGPPRAESAVDGVQMYAAVARGDADAVDRSLALLHGRHDDTMITLIAGGCAVDALTWAGRPDEAVALAHELIDEISRVWSDFFLGGIWLSALGIAALADEAAADRLTGRDPAPRLEAGARLLNRAVVTADRGRPRGGQLGPEGRAWLARAHAEHARLTGTPDPKAWQGAADEFDYGYRYELARTRWRWAEALLGTEDRDAAREQAAAALAVAREIGAAPLAGALTDLSRRARLDLPGVPATSPDVLTAREAEVLALVAEGLSNRQIGERLFISGKTVSVHVSRVLDKLGVGGRAEAVAVAHRRGLLGA